MHRIASLPGEVGTPNNISIIEQPKAPVLFITSANTDISTISAFMKTDAGKVWRDELRAIHLSFLSHQSQIDHYLSTTACEAKIIILRLLGGKSHWPYGIEKLRQWKLKDKNNILIILSGIKENETELHEVGSIKPSLSSKFANLFSSGGIENISTFFFNIKKIYSDNTTIDESKIKVKQLDDPYCWDWLAESYPRVGIIYYSSSYQADDILLAKEINKRLRKQKLSPRCLWVTSLKNKSVQKEVSLILKAQNVSAVIIATSFSTITFQENYTGSLIWDVLEAPIFQMLISNDSYKKWQKLNRGLDPIDLSLQIVLPELDGRINSRICGFKEIQEVDKNLYTTVIKTKPYIKGIISMIRLVKAYTKLANTPTSKTKIALVISNYPIRDGRLANGVGLDTPETIVNILKWLKKDSYNIGPDEEVPNTSDNLIKLILSKRTNSLESIHKSPLTYFSLKDYLLVWKKIPMKSKREIIDKWGEPESSQELEKQGFPIHGITLGNISILIQPSRGYNEDNIDDLHSPYLPPPHRYIAQYLWLHRTFKANCLVHVGKHGTLEWLPGKSTALSESCFPNLVMPNIPNIYPFIVNDPGEGTQAKRRTSSIIVDHLTPPLSKSGLYGDLIQIESLIDEYNQSISFNSDRKEIIENKLKLLFKKTNINNTLTSKGYDFNRYLERAESYLCEIKEAQIRTGLHILGKQLTKSNLANLALCIAQANTSNHVGISQYIANYYSLSINPLIEDIEKDKTNKDLLIVNKLTSSNYHKKSDILDFINAISISLINKFIYNNKEVYNDKFDKEAINILVKEFHENNENISYINFLKDRILSKILESTLKEQESFLKAIKGKRIPSGPSGAPTRGKIEVLPTGRNFFSVDLRGVPTESAWDLGNRSANTVLDLFLQENGNDLNKLAISLWGTATMRNGGEDVAQILSLMGLKPVWDYSTRRVIGLDVIPISVLNRPRVDVTIRISGLFRDAFPQLIDLLNSATEIISNLKESKEVNKLADCKKEGMSTSRVFGSPPETYGTGIQELIEFGNWKKKTDLGLKYLTWSNYLYTQDNKTIKDEKTIKDILKDVQVVIHNQDNREHDILDSDDYYQFHGGLFNAVDILSEKTPEAYISDNSKYTNPKVNKLSYELEKVVRSRLLNPKWINGMMKHGYKGAFEFSATLDYLFSYDATTNIVPNWCYRSIKEDWLENSKVKNFLMNKNPWALRDIAERLIEAANRELWKDITCKEEDFLKNIILNTERSIETSKYLD